MFPYFIIIPKMRNLFIELGKKLNVSEQSRGIGGYYNFLIKSGYDPKKIENIQVNFNGTSATMPLAEKRINYIKRHAHEDKIQKIIINGLNVNIGTRSWLADLFWGYNSLNKNKADTHKILANTMKFYNVGEIPKYYI